MKKYYAIQEIGGYVIGSEVPVDKAELWMTMYLKSPVELKIIPDTFAADLDLNKDGKLDEKDSKIASKVLNKIKEDNKKGRR